MFKQQPSQTACILVTFQSRKRNADELVEENFDAQFCGEELCAYMIKLLRLGGFVCDGNPRSEDFGTYFYFTVSEERYRFVGSCKPSKSSQSITWIAWVERAGGILSNLLDKQDEEIDSKVPWLVQQMLACKSGVYNIRWYL